MQTGFNFKYCLSPVGSQAESIYPGSDHISYEDQQIDSCKSPRYSHSVSLGSPGDEFSGEISGLSSDHQRTEMATEEFYDAYAAQEIKVIVSLEKEGNGPEMSTNNTTKENQDNEAFIDLMNPYLTNNSVEEFISTDDTISEITRKKKPLRTENNQSIFKNKPKELLEQAKALMEELLKWEPSALGKNHGKVLEEVEKDNLSWENDGENLVKTVKEFEKQEEAVAKMEEEIYRLETEANRAKLLQTEIKKLEKEMGKIRSGKAKDLPKKEKAVHKKIERIQEKKDSLLLELEEIRQANITTDIQAEIKQKKADLKNLKRKLSPLRTKILEALKYKKFTPFADLFLMTASLKKYFNKEDYLLYFESYKKKRSMRYFEAHMESKELYFWTVLFNVVLAFLPQDDQDLSLLPLTKSATPFMAWLVDSSVMKIKHKNLFKCSQVRGHLRTEFERVANILLMKSKKEIAEGKWDEEKKQSLEASLKALGKEWGTDDYQLMASQIHKRSWESEEVDDYPGLSDSEEEEIISSKASPQKKLLSKKI